MPAETEEAKTCITGPLQLKELSTINHLDKKIKDCSLSSSMQVDNKPSNESLPCETSARCETNTDISMKQIKSTSYNNSNCTNDSVCLNKQKCSSKIICYDPDVSEYDYTKKTITELESYSLHELKILLNALSKAVEEISSQLVQALQENDSLQQESDARNVAIEQLLRITVKETETDLKPIQMSVILPPETYEDRS